MSTSLRIGLIGLDTSHVVALTELLNGQAPLPPGARVTCAFPAGRPDWRLSSSRIGGFTERVKSLGVEILSNAETVARNSDMVLITEADGHMHRHLFDQVAPLRKPVFIDKPFATRPFGCARSRDDRDGPADGSRQPGQAGVACSRHGALTCPSVRRE